MLERKFQARLIKELKAEFKGCIVLKNDPNYIQGFPDILILFNDRWAALEVKASRSASCQPNQSYYIDILDDMSFAAFISPETKDDIFNELRETFGARR